MKKHIFLCFFLAVCLIFTACGQGKNDDNKAPIEDGVYTVHVETDSSMFHINEACDETGVLTVKDGKMSVHIILASKKITKLYYGSSEDAKKNGAKLIEPVTDIVTYSDGDTAEAYGFDIPVPYLDKEFDVAILGSKDNWYDHKVIVSDPVPKE